MNYLFYDSENDSENNLEKDLFYGFSKTNNIISKSIENAYNAIYELKPYVNGQVFYYNYMNNKQNNLLEELNQLTHELISNYFNKKSVNEVINIYKYSPNLQIKLKEYYENYFILMDRYRPNDYIYNKMQGYNQFNDRIGIHMFCQLINSNTIEIPYESKNWKNEIFKILNNKK